MSGVIAGWADIDPAERRARLRCLRGLIRVIGGGAAASVEQAIADAERDAALLPRADAAMEHLPTIIARRVWSAFAATLPNYDPKADGERSYAEACRDIRERAPDRRADD